MGTVRQDLQYAVRVLLKRPLLTSVIVISLALGIGANTLIFSLVNAVMFRDLPLPDPDRLVILWSVPPNRPDGRNAASPGNCFDLVEKNTIFEHVGCFRPFLEGLFYEDDPSAQAAENLRGELLGRGVQQAIGVQPLMGRWFTPEEDLDGGERVVIISHRLWQRRFAGSSDVIGKKVRVFDSRNSGLLSTVIGVMPAGFKFVNPEADYWLPLRVTAVSRNSPGRSDLPVARLKPGTTIEQVQSAMNSIAAGWAEESPKVNKGWSVRVEPLREAFSLGVKQPLALLQGVVALVLLIACANVAGLLLAEGASQHKELSIRAALGSTRSRIVTHLLTQSVVLSVLGGFLSLAFAWAGLRLLTASLPPFLAFSGMTLASIDFRVFGFTLLVSIVAGFVFGILPALQVSRPDVVGALKESNRGSTLGPARQRLRGVFVVAQISIALVLLIGAGLVINSFLRLYSVDVGFKPQNVMTFYVSFGAEQFRRYTGNVSPSGSIELELSDQISLLSEQIRQRLTTVGGVQSVTAIGQIPPGGGYARSFTFTKEGQPAAPEEGEAVSAQWFPVMGDYFRAVGIPIVRGRDFSVQDTAAGTPVIIISSTMAQRFFSNEDPIGKRIQLNQWNDKIREIVGVAGDIRQNSRDVTQQPQMYVPYAQMPLVTEARNGVGLENIIFLVRYTGSPVALVPSLRSAIAEVNTSQAQTIVEFKPLEEYVSDQLQGFRQYVVLLTIFSVIALILAVVGIYGMMAHSVSQRVSEIGIRMALGATPWNVLHLILRRGVLLIALGVVIGSGASLALTKVIQSFLWGVTPTDPLTFIVVAGVLCAIGLLASYVPARRALSVDPVTALRSE